MKIKQLVAGAIVSGAVILSAGCDAAVDDDPTPVTQFKITPASGVRTVVATSTAAASPLPQGTPAAEIAIKASASTLKFDKSELTAAAGAVTIVFDNQDAGIVHNISVHEGKDATGKTLGKTDLEVGPIEQRLQLDLTAGTYFFVCEAHPTTMKGPLTVNRRAKDMGWQQRRSASRRRVASARLHHIFTLR